MMGRKELTMRAWPVAWPVARSIFDAPYVRKANERTTSWIRKEPENGEGTKEYHLVQIWLPTRTHLSKIYGLTSSIK